MELAIDGEWDESTDVAFKQVCKVLGIAPEQTARTFRIIAGAAAPRTAEELARAKRQGTAFAQTIAKVPPRVVLGGPSLPKAERDRAYIAFVQRTLNDHLLRAGLARRARGRRQLGQGHPARVRADLPDPRREARAADAHVPDRRRRAGRRARTPSSSSRRRRARRSSNSCARTSPTRRATIPAHKPIVHKPAHHPAQRPASGENQRIAAAIRAHGGQYEAEILAASAATKMPVAFLCAVLDVETGFSNVFGHDGVANPIKSPRGSNRPVTKELYLQYRHFRDLGQGCQGVGPMQLTSKSFQDRADALGGSWLVGPNIRIGAEVIRECIAAAGGSVHGGFTRYNGSSAYADNMLKVIAKWQGFLGTKAAADGGAISPVASTATFHASAEPPFSAEVQAFQRMLNRRYAAWKINKRIGEDGRFGKDTRDAAREIAAGMGIARVDFAHGFSPKVRKVMAHPKTRTDAQKQRSGQRAAYRARLRAKYKTPVASMASVSKLLGSHQKPNSAALMKVIEKAGKFGLVVTATTDGQHAATSWHSSGHAVDFGVTGNLVGTPEHMRRLKAFQEAMFKDAPHLLELFGPIANRAVKNGNPTTISGDLLAQHQNHVHVAAK